jgi:acyl-CoA thioesterase II
MAASLTEPAQHLLHLLDLERIDRDIFRAPNPGSGGGRVFGGQVASQALRAAAATVDVDHDVNSLHAYFLRPGRFGLPITCTVDRIRDGSSFTTRRDVALQDGEAILNLDASFHRDETGFDDQLPSPIGGYPPADSLPFDASREGAHRTAVDFRQVPGEIGTRWVRTNGALPDDPIVHACAIAYFSDFGPVRTARRRTGAADGSLMAASLDHCVWFHRRCRADGWLLYRLESLLVAGARGISRGELWTSDGLLAASVAQEVLLRPRAH